MVQNELERVKADLEVMKAAAGMERKYNWNDVYLNMAGGAACLLLALCDIFILKSHNLHSSTMLIGGGALLWLIVITIYHKHKNIQPQRSPRGFILWRTVIGTLFLWALIAWSAKFNLSDNDVNLIVMGGIFVLVGLESAMESILRYQNPYNLTFAIPMMIFGILLPIFPSRFITMFGLSYALGSFAYAGVIAFVIRRQKVINDTD